MSLRCFILTPMLGLVLFSAAVFYDATSFTELNGTVVAVVSKLMAALLRLYVLLYVVAEVRTRILLLAGIVGEDSCRVE